MKLGDLLPEQFSAYANEWARIASYRETGMVLGYARSPLVQIIIWQGTTKPMALLHHSIRSVLPAFGGYSAFRVPLHTAIEFIEAHGTILRKAAWQTMVARAVAKAV